MNIPNEMIVNQVEHRYAGNNWAVVDAHEGEWCDIIGTAKINAGSQIFRAWKKCLSPEKKIERVVDGEKVTWVKTDENVPIHPEMLEKINDIRSRLRGGLWHVKNTRLVKCA